MTERYRPGNHTSSSLLQEFGESADMITVYERRQSGRPIGIMIPLVLPPQQEQEIKNPHQVLIYEKNKAAAIDNANNKYRSRGGIGWDILLSLSKTAQTNRGAWTDTSEFNPILRNHESNRKGATRFIEKLRISLHDDPKKPSLLLAKRKGRSIQYRLDAEVRFATDLEELNYAALFLQPKPRRQRPKKTPIPKTRQPRAMTIRENKILGLEFVEPGPQTTSQEERLFARETHNPINAVTSEHEMRRMAVNLLRPILWSFLAENYVPLGNPIVFIWHAGHKPDFMLLMQTSSAQQAMELIYENLAGILEGQWNRSYIESNAERPILTAISRLESHGANLPHTLSRIRNFLLPNDLEEMRKEAEREDAKEKRQENRG